jgi:hypothetical protein
MDRWHPLHGRLGALSLVASPPIRTADHEQNHRTASWSKPDKSGGSQMMNRTADISLRKAALVAGFGYVIIFVLGFFAFALEQELGLDPTQ